MKKLFMLSMLAILTLTLVGCGKSENGSMGGPAGANRTKEVTLKEALTKKGTQIWYELDTDEDEGYRLDKDEYVDVVYIFKDNKVLASGIAKKDENGKYDEIKLGEITKMSDEEVIKATEVYKEYVEKTYNECMANITSDDDGCDGKETLDNLKYKPFKFKIETDSSGNNTKTEFFTVDNGKEVWDEIKGNYGPYQIYDTNFCGYSAYDYYDNDYEDEKYITKCDPSTVYILDKVGTKGISIDED